MCKYISVITLLVALILPVGRAAAASASINGNVTNGASAVAGVAVTTSCQTNGSTYTHSSAITSSTGHYNDNFSNCPDGSAVTASVETGHGNGMASGVMGSAGTQHSTLNMDIAAAAVEVPEYAPLIFMLLLLAAGAFILKQHRKTHLRLGTS